MFKSIALIVAAACVVLAADRAEAGGRRCHPPAPSCCEPAAPCCTPAPFDQGAAPMADPNLSGQLDPGARRYSYQPVQPTYYYGPVYRPAYRPVDRHLIPKNEAARFSIF
jgi:hypothetical protein